jgi:hypothetical protein
MEHKWQAEVRKPPTPENGETHKSMFLCARCGITYSWELREFDPLETPGADEVTERYFTRDNQEVFELPGCQKS